MNVEIHGKDYQRETTVRVFESFLVKRKSAPPRPSEQKQALAMNRKGGFSWL